MTLAMDPRDAAREWIAETITKHLAPELGGVERIRAVAAAFEDEANERGMSIETAVSLAVEWCENQNSDAGLTHAANN